MVKASPFKNRHWTPAWRRSLVMARASRNRRWLLRQIVIWERYARSCKARSGRRLPHLWKRSDRNRSEVGSSESRSNCGRQASSAILARSSGAKQARRSSSWEAVGQHAGLFTKRPRHRSRSAPWLYYFFFGFRSFLIRLTISEAVRSNSLELESLGRSYADHTTWRDFVSTRNMVPLLRPIDEESAGWGVWVIDSASEGRAIGEPSLSFSSALGSGFSVLSGCSNSASLACKPVPTWSVSTASASLASVTMVKTWSLIKRLAMYWSKPCDIGSTYRVRTSARSAHIITPPEASRSNSRFIICFIMTPAAVKKSNRFFQSPAPGAGPVPPPHV